MTDDDLDLPDFLKVQNRVKLTTRQAIRLWAAIEASTAKHGGDRWRDPAERKREQRREAAARCEARKARELARQADTLAAQPLVGKAAIAAVRSKAGARKSTGASRPAAYSARIRRRVKAALRRKEPSQPRIPRMTD